MSELLSRLEPGHIIPIVAIVGGILWGIVSSLAMAWTKIRKAELQATLKRELIAQGRSADEVERILAAGSSRPEKSCM
jgi:hypothetical protein